jgi:hypothetical protein
MAKHLGRPGPDHAYRPALADTRCSVSLLGATSRRPNRSTIPCNTCHDGEEGGAGNRRQTRSVRRGRTGTPTRHRKNPLDPKKTRGQRRTTRMSESLSFKGSSAGTSIIVTSHRQGDDEGFAQARRSALLSAYFATPSGQARLASRDKTKPLPEPPDVHWKPVTIPVSDHETAFELCDLNGGVWAAVGRLPGVDVTITSRGVPFAAIRLEPVAPRVRQVPAMPDLADKGDAVVEDLETRLERIAHLRLRRWADYFALRDVEIDHIIRLARRFELAANDREVLESHWLGLIDVKIAATLDRLENRRVDSIRYGRIRRHLPWNFLFQLWCNTIGPGGRTWLGNRYAAIRHYTLRLHWRP